MRQRRTRIKICGITSPEAARAAARAGADAIGLVFAPASPRFLEPDHARRIAECLPPFVTVVRVYDAIPSPDPALAAGRPWCQLHGAVDAAALGELARTRRIVRGFPFEPGAVDRWDAESAVDALLIDGSPGGEGASFDHAALAAMMDRITKPVILAGGLNPENVGAAIRTVRPFAVDVSSGVESAPGRKDPELVHAFCAAVREADAATDGP